jgi:hypothetical protein
MFTRIYSFLLGDSKMYKKHIWSTLALLLMIALAVGSTDSGTSNSGSSNSGSSNSGSSNSGSSSSTSDEREEADSYSTIEANCAKMTDAKWNVYAPTLVGKKVTDWSGTVTEVNETLFGDYELWIDMDDPDVLLSVQDVYMPCSQETAFKFDKGDSITFSGVIESVSDLLGSVSITLE